MKRFYYIFPVVCLVVFSLLYMRFSAASDEAEKMQAQKVAEVKMKEENAKKDAEAKAREDSEKRTADRIAEDKAKEAERQAKWEADSKKIADETQQYTAQVAALNSEVGNLEKQLADLRTTKDNRTRDLLNAATEVEMTAVKKHNAELEIQRMTEMVVRRAAKTSLVKQ